MAVTLKDIAKHAGTSRPAVSLYVNDPDTKHVSEINKKRIAKALEELNYRPNYLARSLRGGATMTVGIVGSFFMVPVHDAMNNALIEELRKHGYHVLFGTDLSIKGICAEFEARGVDALIITSCYNELEKKDISVPFLSVTHNQKCFDVAVDMEYGGYLVGRHLLKHGHKKIACVSGTSAPKKRIEGLNRALEEAGLTSCGRFVAQESKGEVTDLVKNAGVSAFFCMNDFIAARVIQELQKHGIKVPQDVAVIGFDGLPFVEFVSPMLSTVVQPVQDLARKSVQILLDKLRGVEQSDKPVLLKPYLLPGGSCGCERNPIQDIVSCGMKTTLDDFIEENPRQKRIWKIEG